MTHFIVSGHSFISVQKDESSQPETYSEDHDDGDKEIRRRSVRQSAQEAVKKLMRNFVASSGDDDDE